MAFSNSPFPRIPLQNEVTDEEHNMFHTIDRMLVRKLIRSLHRTSDDAINVVAFLLWLERDKLSVNAVYKVLTEWPNHLVGILADQVLALLEWLRDSALVWERRGDISLIQELCDEVVSLVSLYQRRFEVMEGKDQIKSEMAERAFRETFPHENRNVQDRVGMGIGAGVGVGNVGGGVGYGPRNIVNRNNIGVHGRVGLGAGGMGNMGPRPVLRNNIGRFGLGIGGRVGVRNVAGGLVYDPRELVHGQTGVQFPSIGGRLHGPQEPESSFGVESATRQFQNLNLGRDGLDASRRYVHDARRVMNGSRFGAGYGIDGERFGHDFGAPGNFGVRSAPGSPGHVPVRAFAPHHPRNLINQNAMRFGTRDDIVVGYQQPENNNDAESADEPSSSSNVPYGPRMGLDTDDQVQRSNRVITRNPIPESELSVLLRGINIKDEETNVHEDDRTVFLTFSRGYPLTESDIWGFFTRRFGNFIKAIHFEEAAEGVQPLYARLVARNSSILPLICDVDENVRTKYVIKGKHVWAKKYVRKKNAPPPSRMSSSASTSQRPDQEA